MLSAQPSAVTPYAFALFLLLPLPLSFRCGTASPNRATNARPRARVAGLVARSSIRASKIGEARVCARKRAMSSSCSTQHSSVHYTGLGAVVVLADYSSNELARWREAEIDVHHPFIGRRGETSKCAQFLCRLLLLHLTPCERWISSVRFCQLSVFSSLFSAIICGQRPMVMKR